MACCKDVELLSEVAPAAVEHNADEFKRMHDLLEPVTPSVERAKGETDWEGAGRDQYGARLDDVSGLVTRSAPGESARRALKDCAPELAKAQRLVEEVRSPRRS